METSDHNAAIQIDSVPQAIGESLEIRAPHIINNLAMRKRMF
jgi:hypothetical protein